VSFLSQDYRTFLFAAIASIKFELVRKLLLQLGVGVFLLKAFELRFDIESLVLGEQRVYLRGCCVRSISLDSRDKVLPQGHNPLFNGPKC
jgi:hypothetical protein